MELLLGNCLDVLRARPSDSIDAIVTDPPYGLSFMGKHWDYDVPTVEIWAECLRVLKPGGHLLAFAGTRTQHRMAVNIEDAGFEIRDMIAWVYGSGFPKSHNLNGDRHGWGTALKPALEPITVARKPPIGTVAANVLEYGTGAINVDACRVGIERNDDIHAKNPHTVGTIGANGIYGQGVATTYKVPSGRWPANFIHDGSDEVVELFPMTAAGNRPSVRNTTGVFVANAQGATGYGCRMDAGSAARFFYCAKASKADRDEGCEGLDERPFGQSGGAQKAIERGEEYQGADASTGLNVVKHRKNHHPTVKPTDLMRYLCRLVTPPGGIVLDPFMGSGSTGKAAMLEGFDFIGIEKEPDFYEIAKSRCKRVENKPEQFVLPI